VEPVDPARALARALPHQHCPAGLGDRVLLRSLPHEAEVPDGAHVADERREGPEQHGGVRIVAARVHPAWMDGRVGETRLLGHGQAVDVGAEQPSLLRGVHRHVDDEPAPQLADFDTARAGRGGGHPGLELASHHREGLLLLEAQLRDAMKFLAESKSIGLELSHDLGQRWGRHAHLLG
jgi:hypothetical protein